MLITMPVTTIVSLMQRKSKRINELRSGDSVDRISADKLQHEYNELALALFAGKQVQVDSHNSHSG